MSSLRIALCFVLLAASAAHAQVTINPAGGTVVPGSGLRTIVGPQGQLQIIRLGTGQVYNPPETPPSTDLFNGFFLATGTRVMGATGSTYADDIEEQWTPVSQTAVTGTGTGADPFVHTTTFESMSEYQVAMTFRYVAPNDFIDIRVVVTPPSGATLDVKAYHIIDTFLAGGDNGPAYREPATGIPNVIGVSKAGQFEVFIQGDRAWDRFYSADFATPFEQIDDGGDLGNDFDTNPLTDNGMGVQWNLGVIAAPVAWTYRVAFTTTTTPSVCGNGVLEGFETCDDDNDTDGDGCSASCQIEPGWTCMGEPSTCAMIPCFGAADGDACMDAGMDGTCRGPDGGRTCCTGCWDGVICDVGDTTDACGASGAMCAMCDDANECTTDACDAGACDATPVAAGTACSAGVCAATAMCVECLVDDDCTSGSICVSNRCTSGCGDGSLTDDEECDDGNLVAGDGCDELCAIETGFTCREQPEVEVLNGSFETDIDGAGGGWMLVAGSIDRVSSTDAGGCWPAGAGNFSVDMNGSDARGEIVQELETVAGVRYAMSLLGSANCVEAAGVPCSSTCTKVLTISASSGGAPFQVTAYALDGSPQTAGWRRIRFEFVAASDMTTIRFSGSDPSFAGPMIDDVAIPATVCVSDECGDGSLDSGEECDDGNNESGDGCSGDCRVIEHGYECTTPGELCVGTCGDGIVVASEECDDGNVDPDDGCDGDCEVEPDWMCVTDPLDIISVCTMIPGEDAGVDAGMDAGPDPDAAMPDGGMLDGAVPGDGGVDATTRGGLTGGGCGCVVASRGGSVPAGAVVLLLVLALRRRRRARAR